MTSIEEHKIIQGIIPELKPYTGFYYTSPGKTWGVCEIVCIEINDGMLVCHSHNGKPSLTIPLYDPELVSKAREYLEFS